MKRLFIALLIINVLLTINAQGQSSLSFGFKYGDPMFQEWDFNSGTIKTRGSTDARFFIGGFVDKELKNNVQIGLGIDMLGANERLVIERIGKAGRYKYSFFSLGPRVSKDLFIVKEKFGLEIGLSLPVTLLTGGDWEFIEDRAFQTTVFQVTDPFGNVTLQPKNDVIFSGQRTLERRFSFWIRPELGLFYNISNKFRITLAHIRGYNTGKPLVARDFDPIVYNGTKILSGSYTASDSFVGNYWSTNIGIEFRPGKRKIKPHHYKPF